MGDFNCRTDFYTLQVKAVEEIDQEELKGDVLNALRRKTRIHSGGEYCSSLRELQAVLFGEGLDCQLSSKTIRGKQVEVLQADAARRWSPRSTPYGEQWDWQAAEEFLETVPAGYWTTPGDLAAAAGKPGGAQAAGNALRRSYQARYLAGQPQPASLHRILGNGGQTTTSWLPDDQAGRFDPVGELRILGLEPSEDGESQGYWYGTVELQIRAPQTGVNLETLAERIQGFLTESEIPAESKLIEWIQLEVS